MATKALYPKGSRFFIKYKLDSPWESARYSLLTSVLSDRKIPFSKHEKLKIPQFGYERIEGSTSNTQLFPTRYVVIDLDTPNDQKISLSTNEGFEKWSKFFISVYNKVKKDKTIPFRVMYLTPSMCGLRFIIKVRNKATEEEEYIQAIRDFNSLLHKYGIGEEHYDIRVNQPWFLPTFKKYYDERRGRFDNPIKPKSEESKPSEKKNFGNLRAEELENIVDQIEENQIDITKGYTNWRNIGFALADYLGEDGRDYYHRISKYYDGYSINECSSQFDKCLKAKGNGITIRTLYWLASRYGIDLKTPNLAYSIENHHCFWHYVKKIKALKIDIAKFFDFLYDEGFGKLYVGDKDKGVTPIFIHRQDYIINKCSKDNIIEHNTTFINNLKIEDEIKLAIRNASHASNSRYSENNLATLKILNIPFKRDPKEKAFLYFKNGFVKISKDEIKLIPYDQIDECIWRSEIIDRDFVLRDQSEVRNHGHFNQFLTDVCTNEGSSKDERRLESLLTIIGFVLHGYKDSANAKAIILMDKKISGNPQGGTGKSLIIESLRKVKSGLVIEDGKRLKTDGRFEWANVERDTKIVAIDDLKKGFRIEHLFSMISNEMSVEKKNIDKFSFPYKESPKFIFSTNYVVPGVGESFERRMIEFELSDYYNKNFSPRTKFGETFFDDWDNDQWELFDNTMVFAIQLFLKEGIIMPDQMNVKYRKAIEATNEDFVEFIQTRIKIGKEYSIRDQYLEFIGHYKEYDYIKQNTFTRWLGEYASYYDLRLKKRTPGNRRLFILKTKYNTNDP